MTDKIALVGCGRMGTALATTLAKSGQSLVVWDIVPAQAARLASDSIDASNNINDATDTASILIFCVPNYGDVEDCLSMIRSLNGKIVINMGEGTAELAASMKAQVEAAGGRYLDAEILTRPEEIGSSDNVILISGSEDLWDAVKPRIGALAGDFRYLSADIGASASMVLSVMGSFVVAGSVALMEGARYAQMAGIKSDDFLALLDMSMPIFREFVREGFEAMSSGNYASESVSIEVGFESAQTFIQGLKAKGLRADMLERARDRFREGMDAGIGHLGVFALDKA